MNEKRIQEQIKELQEEIKRLNKMNELLSGQIFKIHQSIDELDGRINDIETYGTT